MRNTNKLIVQFHAITLAALLMSTSLLVGGCSAQNKAPKFDSEGAFNILKEQCAFGPRPVGAEAHDKTRDYLAGELRKHADTVQIQNFQSVLGGKKMQLSNIIAKFGDTKSPSILLCAHWDTRPTADEELERADRKRPIIGANDGASGVAVLLELARMFRERPPVVPVTIVLFDGEDYGPTGEDMFLGSKYFASNIQPSTKYRYGILLDMIGDKDLQIYRETNSQDNAKSIVDKVWTAARDLVYKDTFKDEVKYGISDDHIPLIKAGIPCIDVIDFDYPYWHTLADTVDKCSADSLKIVGETIAQLVYSEQL